MAKRKGIFETLARRPSRRPSRPAGLARHEVPRRPSAGIPGPSDNPATNFLLADMAIRAGSYLARRSFEKGLLAGRYGKATAHHIVLNKTMKQSALSWVLARVATRSVPGALLVGGGTIAKALLDRRKNRHRSRIQGDAALIDQARGK